MKLVVSGKQPDRIPAFTDFMLEVKERMMRYFSSTDYYKMTIDLGNDMLMCNGGGIGSSYYG